MNLSPPVSLDSPPPRWLQQLLGALDFNEAQLAKLARQTGALQRCRGVRSATHLLHLLLWYVLTDAALRDVAAYSTALGCRLTDEAVRQRFHQAQTFLQALLTRLWAQDLPQPEGWRVLVYDGSLLQPAGSGPAKARLHLLMHLASTTTRGAEMSDIHTAESLWWADLRRGDLVLADQEYSRAQELELLRRQGVELLVRFCNHRWPGQPAQHWQKSLRAMAAGSTRTFEVDLQGQTAYVHVLALPSEKAAEARRKKRARAKKKRGATPSALTLLLAGYVLVLSTLPPSQVSAAQALQLYRRRWQIELHFKRQKSLLGLEQLRGQPHSALCEVRVWAKLLYSWLVEQGYHQQPGQLPATRDGSVWRGWRLARELLRTELMLVLGGWQRHAQAVLEVMSERPRKRRTQTRIGWLECVQEAVVA